MNWNNYFGKVEINMGDNAYVEHIKIYQNQDFQNCSCSEKEKTPYFIKHEKKPLPLPRELIEVIEMLLWYSPNNHASAQSFENAYIQNSVFEDAIITYYLRFLNMGVGDVCFIPGKVINNALVLPYKKSVCHQCHKIIVAKKEKETKLSCILRHLRNCLAHGIFNLLPNNDFIGFDMNNGEYTAVFKTNLVEIHDFCNQLINYPDFTLSHIIQYAFLKNKYSVISTMTGGYNFRDNWTTEDIVFAIKDNHAVRFNCSRYQHFAEVNEIDTIEEYVVVYDEQFNKNVQYVDVFFCEKEMMNCRKIGERKYIIGLAGLEYIFSGHPEVIDNLI